MAVPTRILVKRVLIWTGVALCAALAYALWAGYQERKLVDVFHAELEKGVGLRSPTFGHGGDLPIRCTCKGGDTRPAFEVDSLPEGTQSLALIMTDEDVPAPWMPLSNRMLYAVVNIPPGTPIPEAGPQDKLPAGLTLRNSDGETAYAGPCPDFGRHSYVFRLYALSIPDLKVDERTTYTQLLQIMEGKVLQYGERVGYFED